MKLIGAIDYDSQSYFCADHVPRELHHDDPPAWLAPIWDCDAGEMDYFPACEECGALIPVTLTPDGVDEVLTDMLSYVDEQYGNPEWLDAEADELSRYYLADRCDGFGPMILGAYKSYRELEARDV